MTEQFVLIAYDAPDALERRMASREAHIQYIDKLRLEGKALLGAAQLDENNKMNGSIIFFNMSKTDLDEYMKTEPYIINKVWDKIEIKTCKIGPSFSSLLDK